MKLQEVYDTQPSTYPDYVYVVAEIGINHNGSLDVAKKLISLASSVGCDAVKFQKRCLDIVYSEAFLKEPRQSPWGDTQGDQKRGLEFSVFQLAELKEFAHSLGLEFSCSAWDLISFREIHELGLSFHKVASAMATNLEFLDVVARERQLTLLSLGMCTDDEMDKAVSIFDEYQCPVIPLHCVSSYPSPEDELNLKMIPTMKLRYERHIGYSGHEASVSPSIVAAALGATVIERHITLDRSMYGSDQGASLEKAGIENLVGSLRKLPSSLGSGLKEELSLGEIATAKKLRYWL